MYNWNGNRIKKILVDKLQKFVEYIDNIIKINFNS